jgi:hypothetical protein
VKEKDRPTRREGVLGDDCKEGGSFRVRRKDRLYSRTKTTWFGFNQNYITIKIKKLKIFIGHID